jgi:hypothetical protein
VIIIHAGVMLLIPNTEDAGYLLQAVGTGANQRYVVVWYNMLKFTRFVYGRDVAHEQQQQQPATVPRRYTKIKTLVWAMGIGKDYRKRHTLQETWELYRAFCREETRVIADPDLAELNAPSSLDFYLRLAKSPPRDMPKVKVQEKYGLHEKQGEDYSKRRSKLREYRYICCCRGCRTTWRWLEQASL